MISNSGFPFAPDFLNILRLGQQDEVSSSRKNGSKAKKRKSASTGVGQKVSIKKIKIAKCSVAAAKTVMGNVNLQQPRPKVIQSAIVKSVEFSANHVSMNQIDDRKFHQYSSAPSVIRYDDCRYSLIVALSNAEIKAISGFCSLKLLKGQANLNGHALRIGIRTEVINPSWMPAAVISAEISSSSSKITHSIEDIKSILDGAGLSAKNNILDPDFIRWLNDNECLVLVQGFPRDKQEWILAAEDQSSYQEFSRAHLKTDDSGSAAIGDNQTCPKRWWTDAKACGSDDIFGVVSAVIGQPHDVARRVVVELLEYSPSWVSSVDDVIQESSVEGTAESRTVICGAKGVGKSTCVRYTVNRLLSATDAVAVIDCDLGQPEFTTPGLLSLHIIKGPILSPSHMHLKEPLLSFFIGDLTSKNEPELFAKALAALIEKYNELHDDLVKKQTILKKKNASSVNAFAMLSERKVKPKMVPLPLVVNTDGSIRYMGSEILSAVVALVKPTHVLHISSEKDRDLPALNGLRGPEEKDLGALGSSGSSGSNSNSNKNTDLSYRSVKSAVCDGTVPHTGCRIFTLDPGRLKPSKIHSVDLRTLRDFTALRKKVRAEPPHTSTTESAPDDTYMPKPSLSTGSLSSLWSESEPMSLGQAPITDIGSEWVSLQPGVGTVSAKVTKKALAIAAGEGFHIRKGALVDGAGALALALMSMPPLGVHFSELVFQVQSSSIPPRLILAAVNASLVGILCLRGSGDANIRRVVLSTAQSRGAQGGCGVSDASAIEGESDRTQENEFEIKYDIGDDGTRDGDLPRCIGMGIVRAVDVDRRLLYLLTPLQPDQLNKYKGNICLVRGQVPIPGVMTYAPDKMPAHPYLSSEVTGEGSSAMKTRSNVKRRSHQN